MAEEIPIDWEFVKKLLRCGCKGTEVAARLGIHHDTLYDRTQKEFGVSFTVFSAEHRQNGISLIRQVQFEKAASGDNAMLIWVGKQVAKQSENPVELEQQGEIFDRFKLIMDQISSRQSEADSSRKIAYNNDNAAEKS